MVKFVRNKTPKVEKESPKLESKKNRFLNVHTIANFSFKLHLENCVTKTVSLNIKYKKKH